MTRSITLNNGARLPLVGFGTWQLRGGAAYDAVRHALDVGYRHLDTATGYGNEAEVGRALQDSGIPREEVFVTTKLPPDHAGRERETLTASLHALSVDAVDLWLIHWPPHGGGADGESASVRVWREFVAARDAGLARAIGVSNYSIAQLDELHAATGEMPAANQIPWSPFEYDPEHLAASRERGVVLEGYSPLLRSDLGSPVLRAIAERHGVTAPQVILRWHLEHNIPVIPKSAHKERIEANFDLFGFQLEPGEVAQLDALAS